jgi:hypothetical protein
MAARRQFRSRAAVFVDVEGVPVVGDNSGEVLQLRMRFREVRRDSISKERCKVVLIEGMGWCRLLDEFHRGKVSSGIGNRENALTGRPQGLSGLLQLA